jgi:hypothetical protein
MSFAPLHYRKLRIAEHGAFAILPLYVRCFGEGLKKLCDDKGRIVLDGRTPADVIARRGGAEPSERRRIAADIKELVRVGWLREEHDVLVVVEQEQDWEQLDSQRALNMRPNSSRRASERRPARSRPASELHPACSRSDSSARNHSGQPLAQNKTNVTTSDQQEENTSSPIGEGVQGEQATDTDPTPTLRKPDLNQLGNASDGSGANQTDPAKAQNPTPMPAAPSPLAPRGEPFVPVVDPKPTVGQAPAGAPGKPATLVDLGPPTAPRKAPAKKSTAKKPQAAPAGEPQAAPLPEDWAPNEAHYAFGRELGLQKKHVDYFAGEMRDRAASDGWVSGNWNAKFRNYMRKGLQFLNGVPPVVPDPLPPKVPMPPCPPPDARVLEAAERYRQRMEAGETIDFKSIYKPKFVVPPIQNDFAEECVG